MCSLSSEPGISGPLQTAAKYGHYMPFWGGFGYYTSHVVSCLTQFSCVIEDLRLRENRVVALLRHIGMTTRQAT
jgi:hypothetical protein